MSRRMIDIEVRRPRFEYGDTPRNWMPSNPDLGYRLNGGSLTLPHLEPYLIRVMRKARTILALADSAQDRADLLRDIDAFNGQEANHFKLHEDYNAFLRSRYEGLEPLEEELHADFARFEREESLEWNLGYSAGFETTGMITAQLYFGEAQPGMHDADPTVHALWSWHLAEEYEHRCVAFDVFRAAGGGYRRRLELFFYQARHLAHFGARAAALMREQDEAAGRVEVSPELEHFQRRLGRRMAWVSRARVARALMPWHDPRRHAPLGAADRFLEQLASA